MAVLTVELTEELFAKLKKTGRPAQEVIVEALERALPEQFEPVHVKHDNLSREEVAQRLRAAGLVRKSKEWDTPEARAWSELSEEEKHEFIKAMDSIYFPNSEASRFIIESRR